MVKPNTTPKNKLTLGISRHYNVQDLLFFHHKLIMANRRIERPLVDLQTKLSYSGYEIWGYPSLKR